MATQRIAYVCVKCNNNSYTTDEFRATGGGFSRFFDVQNKKFPPVVLPCGYTETPAIPQVATSPLLPGLLICWKTATGPL